MRYGIIKGYIFHFMLPDVLLYQCFLQWEIPFILYFCLCFYLCFKFLRLPYNLSCFESCEGAFYSFLSKYASSSLVQLFFCFVKVCSMFQYNSISFIFYC